MRLNFLRFKGELVLLQDTPLADAIAEECFRQAIARAHRQCALSWELRAATSLARLWKQKNRTIEASDLLGSVYNQFNEGFGTADFEHAKTLLDFFESAEKSDAPTKRLR